MQEQVVVAYINEVLEVPAHLTQEVRQYRRYAEERSECVSYPKHVDDGMNNLFDSLVTRVTEEEIQEYVRVAMYQEVVNS